MPPRKGVRMLLPGLLAALATGLWAPAPAHADPLVPPVAVTLPPIEIEIPPIVSVSPSDGVHVEVPPVLPGAPAPEVSIPSPGLPGLIDLSQPPSTVGLPVPVPVAPAAPANETPPAPRAAAHDPPAAPTNAAVPPTAAPVPTASVPTASVVATPAAVTGRVESGRSSAWSNLGTAATSFGLWVGLVALALIARGMVASMWRERRAAIRGTRLVRVLCPRACRVVPRELLRDGRP